MVVFSDGEKSSEGLEEAAAGAAREGIFIYAIGMGSTEGSFIPDPRESDGNFRDRSGNVVFSALNEEALQVIAEETDGYYSKGMGAGFINKLDSIAFLLVAKVFCLVNNFPIKFLLSESVS